MTRPSLVPFRAEHLMAFVDRDNWTREGWDVAFQKEQSGPAYTAFVGDQILGCAGVAIIWAGHGVCWVSFSKIAADYGVWFTRICKRVIEDTIRSHSLCRLEAVVAQDNPTNRKWIEMLKFTEEKGCARKYAPGGGNVVRYERII